MRVIYGNCVVTIDWAICRDKVLIFKACNGLLYRTKDYFHENIAQAMLNDLAFNGCIRVNELYECCDDFVCLEDYI